MPTPSEIRKQVTDQIIAALEEGLAPWKRPWTAGGANGRHRNVITGRPYSGINPWLLQLHAIRHGFSSPYWATYQQWQAVGCRVKRRPAHVEAGRWAGSIVFYKPVTKRRASDSGDETTDRFFVLRNWNIFNLEQVEGEFAKALLANQARPELPKFELAERLIKATGATISHGGDKAFYARPQGSWPNHSDGDYIVLPERRSFTMSGAYYETAFHELAHWSEVRLGWNHTTSGYAAGELVAEIAACYMSTELCVPQGESLDNHARYVASWLTAMKADSSYIFKAASQASKVADYLLAFAGVSTDHKAAEEPAEAA